MRQNYFKTFLCQPPPFSWNPGYAHVEFNLLESIYKDRVRHPREGLFLREKNGLPYVNLYSVLQTKITGILWLYKQFSKSNSVNVITSKMPAKKTKCLLSGQRGWCLQLQRHCIGPPCRNTSSLFCSCTM